MAYTKIPFKKTGFEAIKGAVESNVKCSLKQKDIPFTDPCDPAYVGNPFSFSVAVGPDADIANATATEVVPAGATILFYLDEGALAFVIVP